MLRLGDSKSGHFLGMCDLWFFRDLLPCRHFSELFSLTRHAESGLVPTSADNNNTLFWFPPDITPCSLALNPTCFLLAVGCEEGQVLLLDVSDIVPP